MALQSPFFNSNNKREDTYPRTGLNPNAAAVGGAQQQPAPAAPVQGVPVRSEAWKTAVVPSTHTVPAEAGAAFSRAAQASTARPAPKRSRVPIRS